MRVHPKNKLYDREIKMYFYLAKVGFEPTPTSTAAPSNTETIVTYIYMCFKNSNCVSPKRGCDSKTRL